MRPISWRDIDAVGYNSDAIVKVVKIGTFVGGPNIKRANKMRNVTAYLVVESTKHPSPGRLSWTGCFIIRLLK